MTILYGFNGTLYPDLKSSNPRLPRYIEIQ